MRIYPPAPEAADLRCIMVDRWEQEAFSRHPCALHRQLGYPCDQKLPEGLLDEIAEANLGTHVRGYPVTLKLKRRVVAARNARR